MKYNIDYKQNLHTHSTFCDGRATPREMIERAIELGLDSIGFSSHTEMYYSSYMPHVNAESTAQYKKEIRALKEEYRGRIDVYLGLEFDVFSITDTTGLDYMIGGVHSIRTEDGRPVDFDGRLDYVKGVIDKHCSGDGMLFVKRYYEAVGELAERDDVDIIAHFDLVTKHIETERLFDVDSPEYTHLAMEAVERVAKSIPYFEVNVGAISRGYRSAPYPAPNLTRRMLELGMGAVIGTDCHHPDLLYANVDKAIEHLRSVGANCVYVLTDEGFMPMEI